MKISNDSKIYHISIFDYRVEYFYFARPSIQCLQEKKFNYPDLSNVENLKDRKGYGTWFVKNELQFLFGNTPVGLFMSIQCTKFFQINLQ